MPRSIRESLESQLLSGLVLAVLALAVAISTAQAQEARTVLGPTGFSCGMWTNTPKNSAQQAQLEGWVLGLSGTNVQSSVDLRRGRDTDGVTAWIDNYCRHNPLHPIV